ncbi:RNA polymerase sigma factor ShbA [Actinomycetes bacterium KLBMP 9759]
MPADDAEEDRDAAVVSARRVAELNQLAAESASGDNTALDRFLEMIRPPVLRYCRARLGPSGGKMQTAEDVAQDILIAVCGALPRYKASEIPAMAFVIGIARNKVADAYRAANRDRTMPTDVIPDSVDTDDGPERRAERRSDAARLRALLDKLPEAHREVLVLRIALQFNTSETAQTVHSTPGAVRVTQHRALAKLRALVAERMSEA